MTDGSIDGAQPHKYSITSVDKEWLEKIRDLLSPTRPIYKLRSNAFTLKISDTVTSDWLIKNNCVPNKSLIVEMPRIPMRYLPDFVRGCIDGDGCIINSRHGKEKKYKVVSCEICSGSESFILELIELLQVCGFKPCYKKIPIGKTSYLQGRKIQTKNVLHVMYINGKQARKFLTWTYYDDHRVSMERKHKLALEASCTIA